MGGLRPGPDLPPEVLVGLLLLLGLQIIPPLVDKVLEGRGSVLSAVWVVVVCLLGLGLTLGYVVEGADTAWATAFSYLADALRDAAP